MRAVRAGRRGKLHAADRLLPHFSSLTAHCNALRRAQSFCCRQYAGLPRETLVGVWYRTSRANECVMQRASAMLHTSYALTRLLLLRRYCSAVNQRYTCLDVGCVDKSMRCA